MALIILSGTEHKKIVDSFEGRIDNLWKERCELTDKLNALMDYLEVEIAPQYKTHIVRKKAKVKK